MPKGTKELPTVDPLEANLTKKVPATQDLMNEASLPPPVLVQQTLNPSEENNSSEVEAQDDAIGKTGTDTEEIQMPILQKMQNVKNKWKGNTTKRSPRITRARAHFLAQSSADANLAPEARHKRIKKEQNKSENKKDFGTVKVPLQIEEVEIPLEGIIYEEGNVWEEKALPSTPTKNADHCKGILKKIIGLKRKAMKQNDSSNENPQDRSDSPDSKKTKHNVSFSNEPHHTRYVHSPKLQKMKMKKKQVTLNVTDSGKGGLNGILQETENNAASESDNAVNYDLLFPWNPENAKLKPGVAECGAKLYEKTTSTSEIILSSTAMPLNNFKDSTPTPKDRTIFTLGLNAPVTDDESRALRSTQSVSLQFGRGRTAGPARSRQQLNQTFDIHDVISSQGFDPPPPTSTMPPIIEATATVASETVAVDETSKSSLDTQSINTQEILGSGSVALEEKFVNPETGFYGGKAIYPSLFECADPVTIIIDKLARPELTAALKIIFGSVGIQTIGDLSRQTEMDIIKWPLLPPKIDHTFAVLHEYFMKFKADETLQEDLNDLFNQPNSSCMALDPVLTTACESPSSELSASAAKQQPFQQVVESFNRLSKEDQVKFFMEILEKKSNPNSPHS